MNAEELIDVSLSIRRKMNQSMEDGSGGNVPILSFLQKYQVSWDRSSIPG